ncbi:MAG: hypothetical protein ACX93U_00075 [Salipiger thiooxidans]|uniref:hypothetical protein n=1 Tax=Salipiger thiooxidans TaxID=282683 RepID=UPI001CFB2B27|nr:hypothetical protein [Salipiger thiooxidans]
MTEKQAAMLLEDAEGNRIIPKSAAEQRDEEFLAKYGNSPLKWKHANMITESVGKIMKEQLTPMRRRIEALEAEVRAGHERIKKLEAGDDD